MTMSKKNTYCYQRYIFIIVCLSLVTLFIYISYTNGLRHDFLPRLTSHVRKTVCSVMTLPCPDEEEEEGYVNKYGWSKSNRRQPGGSRRSRHDEDGLFDDEVDFPEGEFEDDELEILEGEVKEKDKNYEDKMIGGLPKRLGSDFNNKARNRDSGKGRSYSDGSGKGRSYSDGSGKGRSYSDVSGKGRSYSDRSGKGRSYSDGSDKGRSFSDTQINNRGAVQKLKGNSVSNAVRVKGNDRYNMVDKNYDKDKDRYDVADEDDNDIDDIERGQENLRKAQITLSNDSDRGRNRNVEDRRKTGSSRPHDKDNKNKLGNLGGVRSRSIPKRINEIVNINSPEDDKMKNIENLKLNPQDFQVKGKFTVGGGVKSADGAKPRPDISPEINNGTHQKEFVNGMPKINAADYVRPNGAIIEIVQTDRNVNKSKKSNPDFDVKNKAAVNEEPIDKADVTDITLTNIAKLVPAPKDPPAVVEMKGNSSSSPTLLSSKSLASSSSSSSDITEVEAMTKDTETFPLLDFKPEVTMKNERNFLATQNSPNKQNLPNSSENMTSVAKMERKFLGSVNSKKMRHLQAPFSLYLGERWKGRTLQPHLDDMTEFSLIADYDFLQTYLGSGGLNMSLLSRTEWNTQLLDYELDLLKDPPLDNITHAANNLMSKVYLLNTRNCYNISDVLTLRVDVYDGTGAALRRGGDEIRAWIEEEGKNASVAGTVTDLRNGSYIVSIALKWTGVQKVHVDLTYPRELIRTHYYLRYALKCLRLIVAGYAKAPLSEATLCSTFPLIPGYPRLCNYTDPTYGLTWFCGHPRKTALTCDDWVSIRDLEFPRPLPLTVAEEFLLNGLKQPPPFRLIPNDIIVNVSGGTPRLSQLRCSSKKLRETWDISRPRGFLLHGQWIRTDCLPIHLSNVVERSCLTNTTLVFTGDSNLLMFYTHMQTRTQCIDVHTTPHSQTWHRPRLCIRPEINFRMTWALHGYPVHPVADHWATKTDFQEVTDVIRLIPSEGRYIVVVHLFIHFSIHHYSVFANRMAATKMAVEDLVNRNPDAIVVIRGPHTALTGWPPHLGGDVMGLLMREMTVRLFQNLHDRVLFLDFWDMTIATKNPTFHPETNISVAMMNALLQHVCSRK